MFGKMFGNLSGAVRQYILVTFNYWNFTLTDGALRMLVVLHFHQIGYSPFAIASLFLFYEIFGVITNLVGGWLGARIGLNRTMNLGLALQVVASLMLAIPSPYLSVIWVTCAQALSGIAKDLNKMSAKSAIKTLVPSEQKGLLFKWIAILTGSKNALKGMGFFLGGVLLTLISFKGAVLLMAGILFMVLVMGLIFLKPAMGKAATKVKFTQIFSKSESVNILSAARLFLFASRDVWFVVALPVFLAQVFGWGHYQVGGFLAIWVIGYGMVQAVAPNITGCKRGHTADGRSAMKWALALTSVTMAVAWAIQTGFEIHYSIVIGLLLFGAVFAVNSSLHSYLIVDYAKVDGVSMDVGFYYMANAAGRLLGTVLSGWVYQAYGLATCLWISVVFLTVGTFISSRLPRHQTV